jgi:hypothetical protein
MMNGMMRSMTRRMVLRSSASPAVSLSVKLTGLLLRGGGYRAAKFHSL